MNQEPLDSQQMLQDLGRVLSAVDEREAAALLQAVRDASVIHLGGAGRSNLVVHAFAARLAQLGRVAHVVGDPAAPALRRDDLLVICSASGSSGTMKRAAERAIQAGGRVAVVTGAVISSLARLADLRVNLPPVMPSGSAPATNHPVEALPASATLVLPLRILFEQAAFLFFDILATRLMKATGQNACDIEARVSNLD